MRRASAKVNTATNPGPRPRPLGVTAAAAAMKRASVIIKTRAPYQLKARAQKSPMP